jgi:hypothetical protein
MILGLGLFVYFRMRSNASSKPNGSGAARLPAYKASSMARDSFFDAKPKGLKQNSNFFSPMLESAKSPAQSTNGYLRTVTVTHPYDATLQDELALAVGDQVYIVKEFDDGWALGVHAVTQQAGAFPLVCTVDRSDSGSEMNDNRLTLPPFSASDDQESGWKKGSAESIRISKRMSSQIWDKESRLSSDGRSSVNPFRGRASPSMNSFGSPLKNNFSRDMRDTPKDDYYDELDNDLPSPFGVPSKNNNANYL